MDAQLVTAIIGALMLILAFREFPHKNTLLGAQTIKDVTESLEKAWDRIDELEEKQRKQQIAMEEQKTIIDSLKKELERWRAYAGALQRQIVEVFKGTPLPIDPCDDKDS